MLSSGYLKCRTCTILLLLYACTLEIYIYINHSQIIRVIQNKVKIILSYISHPKYSNK